MREWIWSGMKAMEVQQGQGQSLVPALYKLELWLEYEGSND